MQNGRINQRESYFVAGTDLHPAINMNPGSPSRHSSDAEEEDSPLQQSAYTSHPPMVDSYLEDITSEAEEKVAGQAAEEPAEEEGNDGGAKEEEQDGGIRAEEEQIPMNLHGYWVKCHIKDAHVQALEDVGTVAPRAESHWQTDHKALVPAPNSTDILMLKSHVERGLSMPPSHFYRNLLKYYGLQLHHIAPNNLVSIAGYAALCEGFLRIRPRVDLFQLFFSVRPNYENDKFLWTCKTICFLPQRSKEYPFITPLDSAVGWRGSWFYMADKAAPSQDCGLHPFENIAVHPLDSWRPVNDESATPLLFDGAQLMREIILLRSPATAPENLLLARS
jgi:hypothetical protein